MLHTQYMYINYVDGRTKCVVERIETRHFPASRLSNKAIAAALTILTTPTSTIIVHRKSVEIRFVQCKIDK